MYYTWQQVADVLMVSRSTLWRNLARLGINLPPHSNISDSELDGVMELLVRDFPNNGIVMMWGQPRSMNIVGTRQRVHDSLLRVSPTFQYQEFTDMRNFILRGLAVTARDPAMYGSESAVRIQSGSLQTSCG